MLRQHQQQQQQQGAGRGQQQQQQRMITVPPQPQRQTPAAAAAAPAQRASAPQRAQQPPPLAGMQPPNRSSYAAVARAPVAQQPQLHQPISRAAAPLMHASSSSLQQPPQRSSILQQQQQMTQQRAPLSSASGAFPLAEVLGRGPHAATAASSRQQPQRPAQISQVQSAFDEPPRLTNRPPQESRYGQGASSARMQPQQSQPQQQPQTQQRRQQALQQQQQRQAPQPLVQRRPPSPPRLSSSALSFRNSGLAAAAAASSADSPQIEADDDDVGHDDGEAKGDDDAAIAERQAELDAKFAQLAIRGAAAQNRLAELRCQRMDDESGRPGSLAALQAQEYSLRSQVMIAEAKQKEALDLEPSMNPAVMNSADQNEFNRARMHHDDVRRGRKTCPPEVQAVFDAVHQQANPVYRSNQTLDRFAQICRGSIQVTNEMEEKRDAAIDELNRIAWGKTKLGRKHARLLLEQQMLDQQDQDIDDDIYGFEARAEARKPELERARKVTAELVVVRAQRKKLDAELELKQMKREVMRLWVQKQIADAAIAVKEKDQTELQKQLLVTPPPAAAAAASAASAPVAAAASASSSSAAVAAASTAASSSAPVASQSTSHSKRKERDDELPGSQSSGFSSSQSEAEAGGDGGPERKKKRKSKSAKKKKKERQRQAAAAAASPKVKIEPGLESGSPDLSQPAAAATASQPAAAAAAAPSSSVERSPVPGDLGTDEELFNLVTQATAPPAPAAAVAAAASTAGSSKQGKKHGKKR